MSSIGLADSDFCPINAGSATHFLSFAFHSASRPIFSGSLGFRLISYYLSRFILQTVSSGCSWFTGQFRLFSPSPTRACITAFSDLFLSFKIEKRIRPSIVGLGISSVHSVLLPRTPYFFLRSSSASVIFLSWLSVFVPSTYFILVSQPWILLHVSHGPAALALLQGRHTFIFAAFEVFYCGLHTTPRFFHKVSIPLDDD